METTQNTFEGGLILDTNIATTPKNALSNALNATMSTFNGNELILLNDMGNTKIPYEDNGEIKYACLDEGFVPIGVKVFSNIMYIISYNQKTQYCQIGSFPSPDYDNTNNNKLIYKYSPLKVGLDGLDDVFLTTKFFNFDLNHPVEVLAESSFDNSVNLIFTDNKNLPRLINTGFSVNENNTYTIINRIGSNNKSNHTNRYNLNDETIFNLQTSLYRDVSEISKITFKGLETGGQLMVGSYVVYVIVCDKDGNESDIICESGVIPVFLGTDGDPFSVNGGSENQRSDKLIKLKIENIDDAYHYIKICYTRAAAANNQSANTLAYKILTQYPVIDNSVELCITGYEDTIDMAITDLNLQYFNADVVKTQCITLNILFQGNISEKSKDINEYDFLKKLSLRVYPEIDVEKSVTMNSDYSFDNDSDSSKEKNSYYDSKFCYESTGYHFGEIYRFGIVYIRNDNSLTSVFDILGVNELKNESNDYTYEDRLNLALDYLSIESNSLSDVDFLKLYRIGSNSNYSLRAVLSKNESLDLDFKNSFNLHGVSRISATNNENQLTVVGIRFNIEAINTPELQENYKGFFFVRQKRIPTLLALAYTTNVCEEAFVPSINVSDMVLQSDEESSQSLPRYLYESFVGTSFYAVDSTKITLSFYPKDGVDTNDRRILTLNYQSRLFSLTDNCRAYFDKEFISDYNALTYWYFVERELILDSDTCFKKTDVEGFVGNFYHYGQRYIKFMDQNNYLVLGYGNGWSDDPRWIYEYYEKLDLSRSNFNWDLFNNPPSGSDNTEKWYNTFMYWPDYITRTAGFSYLYFENEDVVLTTSKGRLIKKEKIQSTAHPYKIHFVKTQELNGLQSIYVLVFKTGYKTNYDGKNGRKNVAAYIKNEYILKHLQDSVYEDNYNNNSLKDIEIGSNVEEASTFDGKYKVYDDKKENYADINSYKYNPLEFNSFAGFCPEYELYKGHYNNFFTGGKLVTQYCTTQLYLNDDLRGERLYKYLNTLFEEDLDTQFDNSFILGVDEGVSLMSINHQQEYSSGSHKKRDKFSYFSTKCGNETLINFKFAGAKALAYCFPFEYSESYLEREGTKLAVKSNVFKNPISFPYNLLRGIYSPYVGIVPELDQEQNKEDFANRIVNIYISNYNLNNLQEYFKLRFDDYSAYQAISDRIAFKNIENEKDLVCYRGDCFIGWFTHRINRNFNDSSAPYNDEVLDLVSFKNNFEKLFNKDYRSFATAASNDNETATLTVDTKQAEALLNINLGDLNAILLGSWVTFPIRSTMNLSIRSTDESWTDEKHKSGNARSFFPLHSLDVSGSYKMPDSDNYNLAFSKSGSDKLYFNLNNVIYDNAYYKNRVTYSDVLVNGAFLNGNRTFISTHFRDYTDLYGAIVKILTISGDLIVVCEHGILYLAVRERVHAGNGNNGLVFINTPNILPDVPVIISDTYGSTWPESIIQTPYGIYGVDAVAKKIWYTNGAAGSFLLISDFKVLSFLNKALGMWDKELKIDSINIKSHYNAFKNDVMFTAYYYDKENPNENIMWNLSFNINSATVSNGWQTFFSWIPSYSGNIGNNFITFNHMTDRDIVDGNTDTPTTYLWKHGQSDFIPNADRILPTHWYGEQHPFEFEFVINANPVNHKIFNNLRIVANKAEPESFHYEVIGECYDFDHIKTPPGSFKEQISDKPNMYYRQELTKAFYAICMGSNIRYNKNFKDVVPEEVFKSTMFPLYYSRKGCNNLIYDCYLALTCDGYEYLNLSGGEIVYDQLLNEFKICNHVQGVNMTRNGRLRGNMHYKEDGWYVQIPSINYVLKNEYLQSHLDDNDPKLKIALGNNPLPEDIKEFPDNIDITSLNERLDLTYTGKDVTFDKWDAGRKEMRIKDKYLRIKVRYSGADLAVISGILTLYTNSFS